MSSQTITRDEELIEISALEFANNIKITYKYLCKKWWILFLMGIIGGIIGFKIALDDVPKYESRLTFALDDGGGDAGGVSSIVAQFGLNIGSGGNSFFSGDNILEIILSRRIVEKVLLKVDTLNGKVATYAQHYLDFAAQTGDSSQTSFSKRIIFPVNKTKDQLNYLQDSILSNISSKFSTLYITAQKPNKKLDIYELKVISVNEEFSKKFTDQLILATIDFYTELRVKKSRETLNILEQRVAAMKGNINESIDSRSATIDANLNPAYAAAQNPLQKQGVNIQVYSGAYAEMVKNLELARFQYLKEIPLLQIIDDANYPMKKIKKGKLKTAFIYSVIAVIVTVILLLFFYTVFKKKRKLVPVQVKLNN